MIPPPSISHRNIIRRDNLGLGPLAWTWQMSCLSMRSFGVVANPNLCSRTLDQTPRFKNAENSVRRVWAPEGG